MAGAGLSVLAAASELAPWAKAGGLADVAASLPPALVEQGCQVGVIVPAYPRLLQEVPGLESVISGVPVDMGDFSEPAELISGRLQSGVELHLVNHDRYFDRRGVYSDAYGEFGDNPERFIFFSRAVAALARAAGWRPDILLGSDWQTGLIMALMHQGELPGATGVFTIHNLGYLGLLAFSQAGQLGLDPSYFSLNGLEFYGNLSLLKAGIVYADQVVTVSPTYAREIQTPEFGYGLDGLMRSVSHKLTGILNGVDYAVWDPAHDPALAANYTSDDLAGKRACKADLLERLGLPAGLLDRPLFGMISRLVEQKGPDLVADVFPGIADLDAGLVLLGDGETQYRDRLSRLAAWRPGSFALRLGYDEQLSHQIMAGVDIFLVPSQYEPCGLTQMYSLKYGAIPIVRDTGGLSDSVIDPGEGRGPGTGFKFSGFGGSDLWEAVRRAMNLYADRDAWTRMMIAAMAQDFSWQSSAARYREVFEEALAKRKGSEA
jgi:starch synthase